MIAAPLSAIRRAFDERAPTYDESSMHRAVASAVASFAQVEQSRTVLDVATGTGLVLRALHDVDPSLRLVGADISRGMLAVARSVLPSANWIEADAASLPLPDDSVDLITCVTALHILPDVAGAVAQWRRLLRTGGRVITATFAQAPGTREPGASFDAPTPERPYVRDHSSFGDLATLSGTFAVHGFSVTRHTEWSDGEDSILIAELEANR